MPDKTTRVSTSHKQVVTLHGLAKIIFAESQPDPVFVSSLQKWEREQQQITAGLARFGIVRDKEYYQTD